MDCRRDKNRKAIKRRGAIVSITSILLILALSFIIANKLALAIYNNSSYVKEVEKKEVVKPVVKEEKKMEVNSLSKSSLVLFQAGVFKDLENAEEFKKNVHNKTLASIVNDGKYERVFLGFTDKQNYLSFANNFKKNNIQFVKQIYNIPTDVKYNNEILKILNIYSKFLLKEVKDLSKDEFDVEELKKEVESVHADYGNEGSYKEFNSLKDLISDFDSKVNKEELESVIDFVYSNFNQFKI